MLCRHRFGPSDAGGRLAPRRADAGRDYRDMPCYEAISDTVITECVRRSGYRML